MSSLLTEALGWTLIHSLWQALLVYGTVTIVLRIIPSRHASLRYAVALGSLTVVLVASAVTFWWYSQAPAHPANAMNMTYTHVASDITVPAPASVWQQAFTQVAAHMNLILVVWFAGALLFSLRMAGGVWYVTTLRRASSPVGYVWQQRLDTLAQRLDIHRVVTLATSVRLQAPVVLGYIKPVILVPAGMLAGLSMEQVETILLHELAHIRRHDYLANLAQMLVEALYFFNPCIWALSAQVRTEREHCCDDAVVHYGGNARAYATALVQLEEVRLRQTGVALSLAENKHQLLTRIKRIMEKSVQENSGRERLVPALLLVVGLVCAFWITIGQNTAEAQQQDKQEQKTHEADTNPSVSITADTISAYNRAGKRTHHYERHTTVTIGEDGEPHEVTTESYDGDEAMRPHVMHSFSYVHPVMPVMPPNVAVFGPGVPPPAFEPFEPIEIVSPVFDVHIAEFPVEAFVHGFPPIPDIVFDTIPRAKHAHIDADVEAMQEAILEKLKGQFGDFYGQHEVELEKIMKEVQAEMTNAQASLRAADFEARRDIADFEARRDILETHRRAADHFAARQTPDDVYRNEARQQAERSKHTAGRQQERPRQREALLQQEEGFRDAAADLQQMAKEMQTKAEVLRKEHQKLERYHTALREQLIKDGYIKKGDTLELDENDTEMKVNGKKVKDKDFAEYQTLRKKYVKE